MVYNNLAIQTTFIISDVNCAIWGQDTIMRNGLRLIEEVIIDGYRGYHGNNQTEVKLHYIGNRFYLQCSMGSTVALTTPKTSRVGTRLDFIKKAYNKFRSTETTYLQIILNKKHAYHVHSKHQLLPHKNNLKNTTSLICHTPIGANIVYKESADRN
eukprot:5519809-Amphidinium_carterae.2